MICGWLRLSVFYCNKKNTAIMGGDIRKQNIVINGIDSI